MSERFERERNGAGRMNGMILLSLLIHAVVLFLLFFTPSFPSPKLTFGPVYTVSLVNFSAAMPDRTSGAAQTRELMGASRTETVQKKRLEPEPVVPIRMRSPESRKKPDQTLEKAMEEIRKRAAATAATPKTAEPAPPEAKAAPASASSAGDVDMNAKMRAYYAMIWSRIKGKWALPQGILPGEKLEAVIDVTILRTGGVMEMNFEKRSGNRYFDESAMKAIQKAAPFPPLPAWVGERSLEVGIRFHSSELRS